MNSAIQTSYMIPEKETFTLAPTLKGTVSPLGPLKPTPPHSPPTLLKERLLEVSEARRKYKQCFNS